jgi:non-canonical (house-cleaning) NTP pyrophosphatase
MDVRLDPTGREEVIKAAESYAQRALKAAQRFVVGVDAAMNEFNGAVRASFGVALVSFIEAGRYC